MLWDEVAFNHIDTKWGKMGGICPNFRGYFCVLSRGYPKIAQWLLCRGAHFLHISKRGYLNILKKGYIKWEFLKNPKVAALNWLLKFMKVATLMKVEMYTFLLFFIYFDSIQNKSKYIFEHFHAFILIFPKFVASILWLKVYLDISSHMRLDLHLKTKPNRSVLI